MAITDYKSFIVFYSYLNKYDWERTCDNLLNECLDT